mmetsp:Transcript_10511/g.12044  ORF Transcript_10511/g.12044 Transcript_10511/m.12044 type:complete len:810 (+) Transcript_10511:54-2483(+)
MTNTMRRNRERFCYLFAIILIQFDYQKCSYTHAFTAVSKHSSSKCTNHHEGHQVIQYQQSLSSVVEGTNKYVKEKYDCVEGLLEIMLKEKNDLEETKIKLQANRYPHPYHNTINKRRRKRDTLIERIRYCQKFEELFGLFHNHNMKYNDNNQERILSILQHHHISFFWNQASRFLYNREEYQKMIQHKNYQYEVFFQPLVKQTIQAFDSSKETAAVATADPRSVAGTVYAIAKISSRINNNNDRRSRRGKNRFLLNVENEEGLWNVLEKNIIDHIIATTAKDDNNNTAIFIQKQFSPQDCANILWSFAKLGRKSDRLFDVMTDQLLSLATKGRGSVAADDDASIIGEESFNSQDIAKIVWSYAKVDHHNDSSSSSSKKKKLLFDALSQIAIQEIKTFNSKELANMLWAYAKVGYSSTSSAKKLFDVASELIILQSGQFRNSQTIANTMWAYAKIIGDHSSSLSSYHPRVFDVLSKAAIKQIHTFNSQALANIVWACTKVGHNSPELFDAVSREAAKKINGFSSQSLANMIWAYAKVIPIEGHSANLKKQLFDAAAQSAIQRIDTFKPQELSNMLWSYVKSGHSAPELFDAAALQSTRSLKKVKYSPQTISNMVWAYAKAGHSAPELFDSISQVAIKQMNVFNSQTISNTVWAYTKSGHSAPDLFDAASQYAIEKVDTFTSQNLANTVWAYATVEHSAPDLFDAVSQSAIKRDLLKSFNSQAISNTVWAYTKAGHRAPELFDAASQSAIEQIDGFNPQAISNTVWAYTKAGHAAPELFDAVIESKASKSHQSKLLPLNHYNGERTKIFTS